MHKHAITKSFTLVLLLLHTSTLNSRGSSKKFAREGRASSWFSNQKEGIFLDLKRLNGSNTSMFTKKKLLKRYQPLEITIKNETDTTIALNKHQFGLPLMPLRRVARKVQKPLFMDYLWLPHSITPTKSNVNIGFTAAGILFLTARDVSINLIGASFIYAGFFSHFFLTNHDNKRIMLQFNAYASDLRRDIRLAPGEMITRIIYVQHKRFEDRFDVAFIHLGRNKVTHFNVAL